MPSAGLYGEFLLHAQCWFTCGVYFTHPILASFLGSFSHNVYAGFFMLGISSFQKKKSKKKVKVNKNVHNWVILLFKAEVDIQYRLHKVASCFPADSAEIQTWNGYLLNSNYHTMQLNTQKRYWAIQAGLLIPLTFAQHRLSPLAAFTSGVYFLHNERRWQWICEFANFTLPTLKAFLEACSHNNLLLML